MKDDIELLVVKYLSGEASEGEVRKLKEWISQDPLHLEEFTAYQQVWELMSGYSRQVDVDAGTDMQWQYFQPHIHSPKQTRQSPRLFRHHRILRFLQQMPYQVAAAMVLLLLCTLLYIRQADIAFSAQIIEVHTSEGEQKQLSLPDGTRVWLNQASKVQYLSSFNDTNREVILEGEAFFEVVKDSLNPFLIKAQQSLTQVMGTSFNVRAYSHEETVQVAVLTGSVHFSPEEAAQSEALLTSGWQGIYHKSSHQLSRARNEDVNFLSWKTGRLVFENTPLESIVGSLERHYRISIHIKDKKLLSHRISTSFYNQPLEEVLQEIALLLDLSYRQVGKGVILQEKEY